MVRKRRFTFGVKNGDDPIPESPPMRVKVLPQTGKTKDILRDAARGAKLPGKRVSKAGNIYWETRMNRSDALGKNI